MKKQNLHMNELESFLDQAGTTVDQAAKMGSLYYKTKATLNNEQWLNNPEKKEQAVQSFQRWLDNNAPKMFPETMPDQLILQDGTVLTISNYDPNADHYQITINDIKGWMESNKPNTDDI